MAGGWTRDGAIHDQIESTVEDGLARVRSRLPSGKSRATCLECDEPIPAARQKALPGVQLCVACREERDGEARETFSGSTRRGRKDRPLRGPPRSPAFQRGTRLFHAPADGVEYFPAAVAGLVDVDIAHAHAGIAKSLAFFIIKLDVFGAAGGQNLFQPLLLIGNLLVVNPVNQLVANLIDQLALFFGQGFKPVAIGGQG